MTLNPLSANFTKWSNKPKQFVANLPTNCLSVFEHFVGLALKGLKGDFRIFKYFLYLKEIFLASKIKCYHNFMKTSMSIIYVFLQASQLPKLQNLTILVPCISESCSIEIKIKLNLYFHTSLWCLKRFYDDLQACNFIKKRHQHKCFSVDITKFFTKFFYRTLMATSTYW